MQNRKVRERKREIRGCERLKFQAKDENKMEDLRNAGMEENMKKTGRKVK